VIGHARGTVRERVAVTGDVFASLSIAAAVLNRFGSGHFEEHRRVDVGVGDVGGADLGSVGAASPIVFDCLREVVKAVVSGIHLGLLVVGENADLRCRGAVGGPRGVDGLEYGNYCYRAIISRM
jgi:hypothetical protein